jgi:hypothetical protein
MELIEDVKELLIKTEKVRKAGVRDVCLWRGQCRRWGKEVSAWQNES